MEYSYENYETFTDYPSYTDFEPQRPTGFPWVVYNFEAIIMMPASLILNLILFIKIIRTEKIKSEPWRWLIANTTFSVMAMRILAYNELITGVYLKPSLMTTPICPAILLMGMIFWTMEKVSLLLVVSERFHALRLGRESEGGFGKKAVILCLVLFWLFTSLALIIGFVVVPLALRQNPFILLPYGSSSMCYFHQFEFGTIVYMVISFWALFTLLTVIIGTLVLRRRKTTTDAMQKSIVTPTLAVSFVSFFFMVLPLLFIVLSPFHFFYAGMIALLPIVNEIAFPIIWLVTWTRNEDISLKCGGSNEENKRLLEGQ